MPADDDAAWRAIVANFGERVDLDEPEERPAAPADARTGAVPDPVTEPHAVAAVEDPEDHYVPPAPPPVALAEPTRLLAWLGLFGSPSLVLVAVVTRVSIPSWLGLILMIWFVGGFCFLVASMRPRPDDDNDDGAVV